MRNDLPSMDCHEDAAHQRVKLTRASVACRRCRRLRTKCVTRDGKLPCHGCQKAGPDTASECYLPARGHSHYDRGVGTVFLVLVSFRVDKASKSANGGSRTPEPHPPHPSPPEDGARPPSAGGPAVLSPAIATQEALPPLREIIDGFKAMWTSCFQVGFISRRLFLERLSQDVDSVPLFLILATLAVSCRFTPSLIRRYGSSQAASEYFMQQASSLVYSAMYSPTLENVQSFLMLALAEWGHGDKIRSSTHMGIAVRMAGLLRLHREETYNLAPHATAYEIVKAEIARRTFWVLETEDNLHSSHASPVPFSPDDITALLPCDESDFAFGRRPAARAAMPGTKAAKQRPGLVMLPRRSIFATLLQAHNLWGRVARNAQPADLADPADRDTADTDLCGPPPWDDTSSLACMCRVLAEWEQNMPESHRWSVWNMRGHSAEQVHLAYLSIVMVIRLANIVVRRVHLDVMIAGIAKPADDEAPDHFWQGVADELYENVQGLMEPIDWFMSNRAENEGFSAILLFSLYTSGTLYLQLIRRPELCPRFASTAETNLTRALSMLAEFQDTWPLASRWLDSLTKSAASVRGVGHASSSASAPEHGTGQNAARVARTTAPVVVGGCVGLDTPAAAAVAGPYLPPDNTQQQQTHPAYHAEMATTTTRAIVDMAGGVAAAEDRSLFGNLEMLSAAATSTARNHLVEDDEPARTRAATGVDASFETELTEFMGTWSCSMMNVWKPFDGDGLWGSG